jgi:hypothetical protein
MTWTDQGLFTGSGTIPASPWDGLVRVHLTDLSGTNPFGGITTIQRLAETGWISPYEDLNSSNFPEGDGSGIYILLPVYYMQFEFNDFDFVQQFNEFAGFNGLAYVLKPNVEMRVWTHS